MTGNLTRHVIIIMCCFLRPLHAGVTSRSAVNIMDTSLKSKPQSGLSKRYCQIYNISSRLYCSKLCLFNFYADWIALTIVIVLVIVIVAGVCALLYIYKKGIMCTCKRNLNKLDSIESPAGDDTSEQQQSFMIFRLAHNQPPASTQTLEESRESASTPQVNGILLQHDHPKPNFSDRNSVADNEDHALLHITTPDSSFEDKWYMY